MMKIVYLGVMDYSLVLPNEIELTTEEIVEAWNEKYGSEATAYIVEGRNTTTFHDPTSSMLREIGVLVTNLGVEVVGGLLTALILQMLEAKKSKQKVERVTLKQGERDALMVKKPSEASTDASQTK